MPDRGGRQRLDITLVERGFARSRAAARDAIGRGCVRVDGRQTTRPGVAVTDDAVISVDDPAARYVSRAALKLIAGLDRFAYEVAGRSVLDLGASTGGFTQVLIERGAAHVTAVDVGRNQMDLELAADPRITLVEGVNCRDLSAANLGGRPIEALVADVSFISLRLALPPALSLAEPGAWLVALIKPQFEVGRKAVGKGGIVRDPEIGEDAARAVAAWVGGVAGWTVDGLMLSPVEGGAGNREYLVGARNTA